MNIFARGLLEFAKHYLSDIDGFKEVIELMEQYA